MELFCLYWHIWSTLMILLSENLTVDWKFGKSSTEMIGQQIVFGSEFVIVKQWGMHWSKFRITEGPTFVQIFCLVMFGEPTSVSITDCMLGKSRHRRTSKGALLRMSKSWIIVCWRVWSTSLSRVLSPFKVDPQGSSVKPNWESTGESWYRCPVSADEGSSRKGSGREGLPRTRDFFFFSTLAFYKNVSW